MGLLSSIGGLVKKAGTAIVASKPFKAVDYAYTATILHPIDSLKAAVSPTKTVSQVVAKSQAQPLKKEVVQIATSAFNIGTALLGGSAIVGAAKAGTLGVKAAAVGKALIPKTLVGKAAAVVVAPVVASSIISNPLKAIDVAASTQAGLVNVGANIGNLVADPSLQGLKDLVTENPVIVGAAAAAGLALGAKTILPALVTSRQIEATQEQTAAIKAATEGLTGGSTSNILPYTGEATLPATDGMSSKVPLTPATQEVGATRRRKRYKTKTKRQTGNVSQRVSVNIGRFINNKRLSLAYGAN